MEAAQITAITVTDYATALSRAVRAVGGAVVEGEVQRPKTTGSGMLCFDLTDGDSKLACKVFRSQVRGLEHQPRHGDLVQARVERPDFWTVAGKLDLIVTEIRLAGEGELLRRRSELLARLRAEGLCDPERRRALPEFPRAVGVIAGRSSDGMSDVVRALQDRFPPVHVVACPALVQGRSAPRDIIDALAHMQGHPRVDVVVIARGGGSVQDLVAFDDERLCRAIFACGLPVVTAVGHTDNTPVCNQVAHAAFTPSRSAELVVPSLAEVRQRIQLARQPLDAVPQRVERLRERLVVAQGVLGDGAATLARRGADVEEQGRRLAVGIARQLADHQRDYGHAVARLAREAAGAMLRRLGREELEVRRGADLTRERVARRLHDAERDLRHATTVVEARDFRSRGYVLVADEEGVPLPSVAQLSAGSRVRLRFRDGQARAVVDDIEEDETQ